LKPADTRNWSNAAAFIKSSTNFSSKADISGLETQTPMAQPLKILAIQFKSLGDAVLLIPALQAIRQRYPECALHAFVSEAAAPLLRYEPSLTRLWSIPRVRDRARIKQNWPVIRALRAERFDRSVDFSGNDRGAILSLLCGARERLGFDVPGGFLGRRYCYNRRVAPVLLDRHEALRSCAVLSAWDIAPPRSVEIKIHTDPALDAPAAQILPQPAIICHMGAGMAKKQWPVPHWAALYKTATAAGLRLAFTPGYNPREQMLTSELKTLVPEVTVLPALDLSMFLVLLKRSQALITGDTGPMHFAAGLDVPTIGLFGPTSVVQWAPVGKRSLIIQGSQCSCNRLSHVCQSTNPCMAAISPGQVFDSLRTILAESKRW
jgi:heptosyltransferase III